MPQPSWGAFALAQACLLPFTAAIAYFTLFSTLGPFDDEGFMMMTVRHLLDGHRLYDEVWTAYGPAYYLSKWLLHGLAGLPLTHDLVRLNAAVLWLASAVVCAGIVYGATRSLVLAVVAQVLVAAYLRAIAYEPGHPQELAALLTASIVVMALVAGDDQRPIGVGAMGFLVGALAMVKVNLGAFSAVAVWMAIVSTLPMRGGSTLLRTASTAAVLVLPWLLFRRGLGQGWGPFLAAETSAVSALVLVSLRPMGKDGRLGSLVTFVAACAAGVAASLIFPFARHSTLPALVDALIVLPQRLMTTWLIDPRLHVEPATLLLSVALAASCAWLGPSRLRGDVGAALVAVAKLALAAWTLTTAWRTYIPGAILSDVTPFLWIVLLPLGHLSRGAGWFARLVLVWMAVLQPLQIYPVPGSQRVFGSFLHVVCALVAFGDVLWLAHPGVRGAGVAIMLGVMGWLGTGRLMGVYAQYAASTPLGLPGAERLRLPAGQVAILRPLVEVLRTNADTFFAYPGFNSLYFWTGGSPPTLDVLSHDIQLYPEGRQAAIVTGLLQHRRPYVVRFRGVWPPYPPFDARIDRHFEPSTQIGPYSLLVRRAHPAPERTDD